MNVKSGSQLPLLGCLDGTPSGIVGDTDVNTDRGGLHLNPIGPSPHVFKYGFYGGQVTVVSKNKTNLFGAAPNHSGQCNFIFADFHVESRKICDENAWPWFGTFDGKCFDPAGGAR